MKMKRKERRKKMREEKQEDEEEDEEEEERRGIHIYKFNNEITALRRWNSVEQKNK